jgi:S-methylmethionine-dependent homocysteine/selenocysteine methylase
MGQRLFLTDGGIETTMIFHEGIDLPEFATFVILEDDEGKEVLRNYYRRYLDIAVDAKCGFILEGATWRASTEWGAKLGYDEAALARLNRLAIQLLLELRDDYGATGIPIVISGNIGPRGDGYVAGDKMNIDDALRYHDAQIKTLAESGADMITAMTMTYPEEPAGIMRAASRYGIPSVIGFTTETDGRLPDGTTLEDAIEFVDGQTGTGPAYYMVNCAHIDHFHEALVEDSAWSRRIRGVRANASRRSHAELDEAEELDDGDPQEFGDLHRRLRERFPHLSVFGGCCGTDHRHVRAIQHALS